MHHLANDALSMLEDRFNLDDGWESKDTFAAYKQLWATRSDLDRAWQGYTMTAGSRRGQNEWESERKERASTSERSRTTPQNYVMDPPQPDIEHVRYYNKEPQAADQTVEEIPSKMTPKQACLQVEAVQCEEGKQEAVERERAASSEPIPLSPEKTHDMNDKDTAPDAESHGDSVSL